MTAPSGTIQEAADRLRVGDIVLFHNKKSLLFRRIQRMTGSYWNHAGLVFSISRDGSIPTVLIIEAAPHGIEVHRLKVYTDQPEVFDLGVKRMPLLTDEYRDRFRGIFLDVLDTPYDHARLFGYLFRDFVLRRFGRRIHDALANRLLNTDYVICSSFIQRAYYLAVPPNMREKTLFREDQEDLNFIYRMEYITPADIARSKNTEWICNPHD